jgi:hypothetical protein
MSTAGADQSTDGRRPEPAVGAGGERTEPNLLLGYVHASVLGQLRPEVAYPDRKVKPSQSCLTTLLREPCHCGSEHLEVWVVGRQVEEQLRLFY